MTRKIETGCFAIIRVSGEAVVVGQKYIGYRGIPTTFATSAGGVDMGEYAASELKRIDAAQFAGLEVSAEERMMMR